MQNIVEMSEGLRYNEGKTRYDLIPTFATEQLGRVMTYGANKYQERNWEKGMAWSKVLASLERHLAAVKSGQDYDPESGLLHTAHIMANAAFLTEYYRIYPQGDDRPSRFRRRVKIGLDIDEVICDFVGGWIKTFGGERPSVWNFGFFNLELWNKIANDPVFWRKLEPKVLPDEIPFEPHCYITSRPQITNEVNAWWLDTHGFPRANIYRVNSPDEKLEVIKDAGIEVFVEDNYDTFMQVNRGGILCYLMDAPHNRRYDVGHLRINSLMQLKDIA